MNWVEDVSKLVALVGALAGAVSWVLTKAWLLPAVSAKSEEDRKWVVRNCVSIAKFEAHLEVSKIEHSALRRDLDRLLNVE